MKDLNTRDYLTNKGFSCFKDEETGNYTFSVNEGFGNQEKKTVNEMIQIILDNNHFPENYKKLLSEVTDQVKFPLSDSD